MIFVSCTIHADARIFVSCTIHADARIFVSHWTMRIWCSKWILSRVIFLAFRKVPAGTEPQYLQCLTVVKRDKIKKCFKNPCTADNILHLFLNGVNLLSHQSKHVSVSYSFPNLQSERFSESSEFQAHWYSALQLLLQPERFTQDCRSSQLRFWLTVKFTRLNDTSNTPLEF